MFPRYYCSNDNFRSKMVPHNTDILKLKNPLLPTVQEL